MGQTWRKTLADLRFVSGWGIMVPIILYAIYVLLVWYTVGIETAGVELRDKLLWICAPLAAFPIWYVFSIPAVVAKRERSLGQRLLRLKTRLTPRFEISSIRHTFDNHGNMIGETAEFLCLAVKNVSDRQSDVCGAQLIELHGDNGSSLVDSIELAWLSSSGNGEECWGHIATGATKTVKVFRVSDDRLGFNMPVVPTSLNKILQESRKLSGKIAFDDRYFGGQIINFILHNKGEPCLEIINSQSFQVENQKD